MNYPLKYLNTGIVFQEVPDQTTLSINITHCPCRCPGCHSSYLWEDVGTALTPETLETLIADYDNTITCVCFMGGDRHPKAVAELAKYLHQSHPQLKVAWYSGRQYPPVGGDMSQFDYYKLGPYIAHLGPLNATTTNQRLYQKQSDGTFVDITSRFWKTSKE